MQVKQEKYNKAERKRFNKFSFLKVITIKVKDIIPTTHLNQKFRISFTHIARKVKFKLTLKV